MKYLSDSLLLEVYERAVNMDLEPAFIQLLYSEIERRKLPGLEASAHRPATRPT
ncbi:MAG: sporulation histidine kinase inhibitor Sda [Brevibacillus sp.]|nr:sporulation histidine kinase inhibitor Sda [Brevibacillus sp.]